MTTARHLTVKRVALATIEGAGMTPPPDDRDLLSAFEAGVEPSGGFHHADHVHVAWIYLGRMPLLDAAPRFSAALRRFTEAQGRPDRYHETITIAFLLLIHDRTATRGRGSTWREFADANVDLLEWPPSILERYYSPERLQSDAARRAFLWPDLAGC